MLVRPSVVQVSKYGEYTWRGNACGGLVGAAETAGAIAARMGRIAAESAIRRDRRAMRNLPGSVRNAWRAAVTARAVYAGSGQPARWAPRRRGRSAGSVAALRCASWICLKTLP